MLFRSFDDGAHNDGAPNDGVFGAILGPQPNRAVIEFYVEAADPGGVPRIWPKPGIAMNTLLNPGAFATYQVDDGVYSGAQPMFRIVLTEAQRAALASFPEQFPQSNAGAQGTLVFSDGVRTEIRYNARFRNRGASSRTAIPPNYRVTLPADRPLRGVTDFNLNSQEVMRQIAGWALAARAGA